MFPVAPIIPMFMRLYFSILPIFQELAAESGSSKVGSYDKNYAKMDTSL